MTIAQHATTTRTTTTAPEEFGEEVAGPPDSGPAVTKLGHNIGALITGVEVSGEISDDTVEFIRTALATHKVVVFRGQHHVDDQVQRAFAERLGTPTLAHPTVLSRGRDRLVIEGAANSWHTDVSFVDRIPKASILRPETLPAYGGATLWANTVAAYASLPSPLRYLADSLWAHHTNDFDYASQGLDQRAGYRKEFTRLEFETVHPVVHVHAETGERSLLLGHFISKFAGLRTYESQEIYRIFQERLLKPDNTFRWAWSLGDLVIWDNHATQHYGVSDFGDQARFLHRVTLAGPVPVSINGEKSIVVKGDASEYSIIPDTAPLQGYRGDAAAVAQAT